MKRLFSRVRSMKVLHFLRHAKSDWDDPALADHARPLAPRGVSAARTLGRALAAEGFRVDRIACSTARRARETCALLGKAARDTPVSFHDELYLVPVQALLAFIRDMPDTAAAIMVVGHNPTTHDAALLLAARAARGQRKALALLREKYPTGALCTIRFDVARWRSIKPGTGTLLRFTRPRDLADDAAAEGSRTPATKRAPSKRAPGKRTSGKRARPTPRRSGS